MSQDQMSATDDSLESGRSRRATIDLLIAARAATDALARNSTADGDAVMRYLDASYALYRATLALTLSEDAELKQANRRGHDDSTNTLAPTAGGRSAVRL
jgi:hypothetical protein